MVFDLGRNSLRHIVLDFKSGNLDCMKVRLGIGATVALDDDAVESQQAGTIMATRIQSAPDLLQYRQGAEPCQFCQPVALELAAQNMTDQRRQALACFQLHVANKTIGDNDVDRAFENIIALDKSVVIQPALAD